MHNNIDAIVAYLRHIAIDLLRIGEPVNHDALAYIATQTMANTDPAAIHEAAEEVAQCFAEV